MNYKGNIFCTQTLKNQVKRVYLGFKSKAVHQECQKQILF